MINKLHKSTFLGLATAVLFTPMTLHNTRVSADTSTPDQTQGALTGDLNNDRSSIDHSEKILNDRTRLAQAKDKLANDQEQADEFERDMRISFDAPGNTAHDQKVAHDNNERQIIQDKDQLIEAQAQLDADQGNGNEANDLSNGQNGDYDDRGNDTIYYPQRTDKDSQTPNFPSAPADHNTSVNEHKLKKDKTELKKAQKKLQKAQKQVKKAENKGSKEDKSKQSLKLAEKAVAHAEIKYSHDKSAMK